ncbi:MAG: UDP-N-acetylglucosamine--N-acetylmuramyl-(pentapeptide) pyrophosphoryl-undecaprenol N-acetylglucosamine transferase [Planctomycetota bacterium]
MKVAFLGGGTGGHLVPGVAVAEELRDRGHEALFLIAGRPVEQAVLEPRHMATRELFGNRPRPSPLDLPSWLGATARWRRAVTEFDPAAIVVLGGWVALPALLTGFFGRPSILIEQNARPGKVQRWLSQRGVEHACLTVGGVGMPRGRRSTRVTGNPAPPLPRRERGEATRTLGLDPERRTLLLMGGSQGAGDVNALLPAMMRVLEESGEPWQVLNITGDRPCPAVEPGEVPVLRRRFVQDMAAVYSASDVAVCRAGGGTVAELACTGLPAVLVPYPHHADHHQEANGQRLVEAGGALMVQRDDPSGCLTAPALLAQALTRLPEMAAAVASVARPDAARDVADIVLTAGGDAA